MKILHLTDLHFTYALSEVDSNVKWKKILGFILKACKRQQIDMVAVTGDFCCHGAEVEFRRAETFLNELLENLNLSKENLVMCQGNHDTDGDEEGASFEHYQEFCSRFTESAVCKNDHYVFISMNTCSKTSLLLYENAVLVPEEVNLLNKVDCDEFGIVLMHHPPETINNQEIFEKIVESGKVKLILSGHQHMSLPRIYQAGNVVVVGGMAVSPHRQWMASGGQIVEIDEKGNVKAEAIKLTI